MMMVVKGVISFLFVFCLELCVALECSDLDQKIVANTELGKYRGVIRCTKDDAHAAYTFLGIPYAQPPVGSRKWEAPQPITEEWYYIKNATEIGPMCLQDFYTGSTMMHPIRMPSNITAFDCLTLNIYTPGLKQLRPVLVWIHGGNFIRGSGSYFDGTALAAMGNIVVVTINYRLGIWGFPRFSQSGNFGLMDQQFALHWVSENIQAFGGDKDRITLGGHEAGAAAVSLHMMVPKSHFRFQRAIVQSGSFLSIPFQDMTASADLASKAIAKKLGCNPYDFRKVLECVKRIPDFELLTAVADIEGQKFSDWHPHRDGTFLNAEPLDLIDDTFKTAPMDIMYGVTQIEGFMELLSRIPDVLSPEFSYKYLREATSFLMERYYGFKDLELILDTVFDFYVGLDPKSLSRGELRDKAQHLLGDLLYTVPTFHFANLTSDLPNKNVYFYDFVHRMDYLDKFRPSWNTESEQLTDVILFWGLPFVKDGLDIEVLPEEYVLSKQMMRYMVNFIESGNPNSEELPQWPAYETKHQSHLKLGSTPTAAQQYAMGKVLIWTEAVPYVLQDQTFKDWSESINDELLEENAKLEKGQPK